MIQTLLWLALASSPAHAENGGPLTTAGAVVRSKEWLVRRAPQREEEFVGDVSYHQGPSVLTADWALLRHALRLWKARGRVKLVQMLKSGDRVEVMGENAEYSQNTARGWLTGNGPISFYRYPAAGPPPDEGTAQRLDWEGREKAHLTGGVHVWGPRAELWSGQADYDAAQGVLTCTQNRPVLHLLEGGWTGAVQAESLAGRQNPDRFWADGRTMGWIKFKDNPEKLLK